MPKTLGAMKIVVVGGGVMGSGIAYVCGVRGFSVVVVEQNEEMLSRSFERIRKHVEAGISKRKLTPEEGERVMRNISGSTSIRDSCRDCDVVIEAVYEDLDLKKKVFRVLGECVPEGCVMVSNTSSLSISELCEASGRPEMVLGMHFFNPVPAMKLVEIVRGRKTSERAIAVAVGLARELGKEPVLVNDAPGFVVNRILFPLIIEAIKICEEGVATIEEIDKAMVLGANLPMGPLRLADVIGLDVCLSVLENLEKSLGDKYRPPELLRRKVSRGELGVKTGTGFYRYR